MTNKTPRGGVHYKKIGKFFILILFLFTANFGFGGVPRVYAGDSVYCFNEPYVAQTLYIEDGVISYPEGVDSSTAVWDQTTSTLTLNNYNGAPLCFYSDGGGEVITIILKGTNNIDMEYFAENFPAIQQNGENPLVIDGDGDLNVINSDGSIVLVDSRYIVLKSGTVNITSALGESCYMDIETFIIENGSFSTSCYVYSNFFIQRGGSLDIDITDDHAFEGCLELGIGGYIDSGVTNITCESTGSEHGAAIMLWSYAKISSRLQEISHFTRQEGDVTWVDIGNAMTGGDNHYEIPVNQEYNFYIAGGDITLVGSMGIDVEVEDGYGDFDVENAEEFKNWAKSFAIGFDEDVIVEPSTIKMSLIHENEDEYGGHGGNPSAHYILGFTDVQDSDTLLDHFHIYKVNTPVPGADGDEEGNTEETEKNPNTIDFRLFSIIAAILVSIVAEAFIIMDLKRRVHDMQNEITVDGDGGSAQN